MEDVWKIALNELKKEMPEDFFEPFIKPLRPISISKNSDTFVLGVPNSKIISHLRGNYKISIQSKLKSLMGRDVIVDFQEISEPHPAIEITTDQIDDILQFKANHTFENFILSPSNEFAYSACQSILNAKKPSTLLFLTGKSGLGKTHLIQSTAKSIIEKYPKKKIYYATAQEFKESYLNSLAHKKVLELKNYLKCFDVLILEDLQLLGKSSESTQEEFFYLFNNFFEKGNTILLSADIPVSEIPISERLKSRFLSGLTAEILPPDSQLRLEFLKIKNNSFALNLSEDTLNFLANSITNNIRMLDSAINMIQFLKSKNINVNDTHILNSHLKNLLNPSIHVPIDVIIELVCDMYGVNKEDLFGKTRKAEITLPRHLAMYLSLKLSGNNKSSLARFFKKSDHTIIINAEKKIKKLANKDPAFNRLIENCIEKLWKNRG